MLRETEPAAQMTNHSCARALVDSTCTTNGKRITDTREVDTVSPEPDGSKRARSDPCAHTDMAALDTRHPADPLSTSQTTATVAAEASTPAAEARTPIAATDASGSTGEVPGNAEGVRAAQQTVCMAEGGQESPRHGAVQVMELEVEHLQDIERQVRTHRSHTSHPSKQSRTEWHMAATNRWHVSLHRLILSSRAHVRTAPRT
jgi:hypothetical protein